MAQSEGDQSDDQITTSLLLMGVYFQGLGYNGIVKGGEEKSLEITVHLVKEALSICFYSSSGELSEFMRSGTIYHNVFLRP